MTMDGRRNPGFGFIVGDGMGPDRELELLRKIENLVLERDAWKQTATEYAEEIARLRLNTEKHPTEKD